MPNTVYAGCILAGTVCILLPILVLILWKKRTKVRLMPALVGALTFALFALGLETIPKYFLYLQPTAASAFLNAHPLCYALVGAALAGIFEECGRFLAFQSVMRRCHDRRDAITYGIGHGGLEAAIIGVAYLQYLVYAVLIQNGSFAELMASSGIPQEQIDMVVQTVSAITIGSACLGIWERILAMALHIALSVLVFRAAREKQYRYLFPLAILLHTGVDIFAGLYQTGILSSLLLLELLLTILLPVVCYFAWRQYQSIASR